MVYLGTYKGGVVVLEGSVELREGQRVEVVAEPSPSDAGGTSALQELLKLSGVIKGGPSDASENHDHYIYGAKKRDPES